MPPKKRKPKAAVMFLPRGKDNCKQPNRPKKSKNYTSESLVAAMRAVREGCGVNWAAEEHVLNDHLSGQV